MDVAVRQIKGASPLRYPGGKSALTDFIAEIIDSLCLDDATYVEPYAGGAGAALALLDRGAVAKVVINDLDPAIYSFWEAVVNHNESFLELFDSVPITLDEWDRQKAIYRVKDVGDPVSLGFATYFLNRTNRSGVLNAGVIGGRQQAGAYRVGARFNKEALRPRLAWIGEKREHIKVTNVDGLQCIEANIGRPGTFIYADPPYFDKGSYLYLNAFGPDDHKCLAALLRCYPTAPWLLSYDLAPEIVKLYTEFSQRPLALNYSAHRTGTMNELVVVSKAVAPLVGQFDFSIPVQP
ncbi:DNA adenine methylase [Micrococcaceae bacterium RIT802]|nr:DNA adenine methylase [Micrococcaceae bacterium RIT 802]